MIRINLLDRDPLARSSSASRGVHLILVAAITATVLILGFWFLALRRSALSLDEAIRGEESGAQQATSARSQLQTLEARRAVIAQRLELLVRLRQAQAMPSGLIDEIARSVPDRLWLTELTQHGTEITLSGQTTSLTCVADFVRRLESGGWFATPIRMVDTEKTGGPSGDLVRFSVKATTVGRR